MEEESGAAEVYDTTRFSHLYHASRQPSPQHLGLAARFLISLFRSQSVLFAFLGGWAVYLRGGNRMTEDVDVTVATTMETLKAMLMRERRICVPKTHGTTCIQIFVHTGGSWDDHLPPLDPIAVSVDIIINGNLGTPSILPEAAEMITPAPGIDLAVDQVPVIDIYHQFSTKLHVHYDRRNTGLTDDYVDLEFLAETYWRDIWEMGRFFNPDHRHAFWEAFAAKNHGEDERIDRMKTVLCIEDT